jgi:hypothetical protein
VARARVSGRHPNDLTPIGELSEIVIRGGMGVGSGIMTQELWAVARARVSGRHPGRGGFDDMTRIGEACGVGCFWDGTGVVWSI